MKIFYFNVTEIASLVGMSPFSSGRTSLLKAWKNVDPFGFSKASRSFEKGELEKAVLKCVRAPSSKQDEDKNMRCLNGIEREPIILDIVEKMYRDELNDCEYDDDDDTSTAITAEETYDGDDEFSEPSSLGSEEENRDVDDVLSDYDGDTTQLRRPLTSKVISYGSLLALGVGINLMTYYNHTLSNSSSSFSSSGDYQMSSSSSFVPLAILLNTAFFFYSAGVGYLLSSCSSSSSFQGLKLNGKDANDSNKKRKQKLPRRPPLFVERNCETKYLYITPAKKPFEIKIGGRCDGIVKATKEIIECKARQNKLFNKVYDTEKVQAIMYLAIMNDIETKRFQAGGSSPIELDFIRCKLIEEYKGDVNVHIIRFDLDFYEKVKRRLVNVTDLLYRASILKDPKAQLEIFKMKIKADDDEDFE